MIVSDSTTLIALINIVWVFTYIPYQVDIAITYKAPTI